LGKTFAKARKLINLNVANEQQTHVLLVALLSFENGAGK